MTIGRVKYRLSVHKDLVKREKYWKLKKREAKDDEYILLYFEGITLTKLERALR